MTAPPRTDPIGRRWAQPNQLRRMHSGQAGSGRFPRSLWFARWRRSPALSLRPRHGYPAARHRGLPGRHPQVCPGVPRSIDPTRNGCAPRPALIRQIW